VDSLLEEIDALAEPAAPEPPAAAPAPAEAAGSPGPGRAGEPGSESAGEGGEGEEGDEEEEEEEEGEEEEWAPGVATPWKGRRAAARARARSLSHELVSARSQRQGVMGCGC